MYLLSIMYGQTYVLLFTLTSMCTHSGSIKEAQYLTKAHLYIWNCGSREAGNATALTVLVLLVYIYIYIYIFFLGGGRIKTNVDINVELHISLF